MPTKLCRVSRRLRQVSPKEQCSTTLYTSWVGDQERGHLTITACPPRFPLIPDEDILAAWQETALASTFQGALCCYPNPLPAASRPQRTVSAWLSTLHRVRCSVR